MWVDSDGVIDIHAVTEALARAVRASGVRITTGCGVERILAEEGRVCGVLLEDGRQLHSARVVNAAGAWSASLGEAIGVPLSLVPLRRHLAVLDAELPTETPVVWNLGDELYFRPETGGLLASPCDETPWEPCLPPTSMDALELLGAKLSSVAPRLADLSVRRSWACLRTFAPDRQFVAGADPRLDGLYWLGGFGGRGMTEGLAAGEVLGAVMAGEAHPLAEALSPARLLA
jgi:D-arginine dehydrogenase